MDFSRFIYVVAVTHACRYAGPRRGMIEELNVCSHRFRDSGNE
jgi:ribosomal protein S14